MKNNHRIQVVRKLRRTGQNGATIEVTTPKNAIKRELRKHGLESIDYAVALCMHAQFYRLTIISEYGNTEGEGFYPVGSDATISANSPVNVEEGVRYVFTHWTGDHSSNEIIVNIPMNMSKTITANWKKQYYLAVNSSFGSPQGEGWYDANSTATFSVSPPDGFVIRHWFKHWAGDSTSSSQNSTIYMDGAKIVRAIWETDYSQLILILGISGFVGSLFVVIVYRRKRLQQG